MVLGKAKGKKNRNQETESSKSREIHQDMLAIFGLTFLLALIAQKAQWFIDWDTLESVLKLNSPGYNPVTDPSPHYHVLIEPLVYSATTALSPLLGPDSLVGFMILVSAFAGGLLTLAYYTVYKVTGDRSASWVTAVFIGVSYNFVFLTLSAEQNIINEFFNLLSVFLAFAVLGIVRTKLDSIVIAAAFGLSIALSIGTNLRSLYLLLLLPLVVLLCKDRVECLTRVAVSVVSLSIAAGGIVLTNVYTTSKAITLNSLAGFFNVDYYQEPGLWFFANTSRSLSTELILASGGLIRSLFGDYLWLIAKGVSDWLPVLAAVVILAAFTAIINRRFKEPAALMVASLFLLNSVHSFFYEPKSVERWDHAVLFLGLLAGIAWYNRPKSTERYALIAILGLTTLCTILSLLYVGQITTFAAFSYEKVPAETFYAHPGTVVTVQNPETEYGLYLQYLYGRENVLYINSTVSPSYLLSQLKRANSTVYYDEVIFDQCSDLNPSDGFLARSTMVGSPDLPWYVFIK